MRRYDEEILNSLLDSLERRKDYGETGEGTGGGQSGGRRIYYRIDRKKMPDYFDTSSLTWQTLHEQLEALQEKGLVELHWRAGQPGHILEKVSLVREHVSQAYVFLGRRPKAEKEQGILEVCGQYREGSTPALGAFLVWLEGKLETHGSIRQFADPDDLEGFCRLCEMLKGIETNAEDLYLREFSMEVFHDSKTAEKEADRAASVLRTFGGEAYKGLTTDEILSEHGIHRTPTWVYVKGCGHLCIGQRTDPGRQREDPERKVPDVDADLRGLQEGIGITGKDLRRVFWDRDIVPKKVLTIENLTSFHRWQPEDGENVLVIYLGGFAGKGKREFLQAIHRTFSDAKYLHFGDIDCGGFRIWRSLCERTGIPFKPYRMDLATWEEYRDRGRPLTAGDRKTLQKMRKDPYYADQQELFSRMLEEDVKLEQEIIQ